MCNEEKVDCVPFEFPTMMNCLFFDYLRYYEQQIQPGGEFLLYHNTQYKIEVSIAICVFSN